MSGKPVSLWGLFLAASMLICLWSFAAVANASTVQQEESAGTEQQTSPLDRIQALIRDAKYREAEVSARELLAEMEEAYGKESIQAAEVLDALVEALGFGGKSTNPESRELAERAVKLKEQLFGTDHPEVAKSLNNLGSIINTTTKYDEAEEIHKRRLHDKIKVKTVILGAERHSKAMRERIKELMRVDHVYDIYGLTEVYGPGTGLDCSHHHGIHYWADRLIFEIIDPVTLTPVPEGEQGELVVTTLCKEGSPLIRYRTHDVTSLINGPCPCGTPFPRHDRIMGRTDDMFIYRAVNIYPSQIDHILSGVKGVGSEFQIHLNPREDGRDMMSIKVERDGNASGWDDGQLVEEIASQIRRKILVRSRVEIVDHGALPRTQRKSQRVFDHRNGNGR